MKKRSINKKSKMLIGLLIVVMMVTLGGASTVSAASNTVIKDRAQVSDPGFVVPIQWMIDTGVTSVNPYNPQGKVTREQMAAFMYRLAGSPALSTRAKSITIKDRAKVSEAGFVAPIQWMMDTGVTSVNPYNPQGLVTREQMAAFMYRLAGSPALSTRAKSITIKDRAQVSEVGFVAPIQWMMDTGVTSVNPYNPQGLVTREQMAAFMYRLDSVVKNGGSDNGGSDNEDPISGPINGGGENEGKTWHPPVYEIVHHPAEYIITPAERVWIPVGNEYVSTCRCGFRSTVGEEFRAHLEWGRSLPTSAERTAHGGYREAYEPVYGWVDIPEWKELVKEAWDEEVLVSEGYWA